ncbi:MAG: MotA/TolQ/ExbB proton channel family protein [Deltaproteobacteria bacterium]|nr:MotA/TolQ/ExbB proton channel family protein [Nannocystaceae bacterium]
METLSILVAEGSDFSLTGMWAQMGFFAQAVLIFLGLMFVVALAIIIERLRSYGRAKKQSINYIMLLRTYLQERKMQEAVAAAQQHGDSPVAKVVGAGLREYLEGLEALREEGPDDVGDFDLVDAVNRQMERAKERETANLKRGLTWLATVGSTAPFVGLLGTVVGIINSFQGLSSDGGGGLSAVSGGISEALVATAVGLLVAIPAVMMFNAFNARVESYQIDMNDVASELVDFVLKEGRYT